MSKTLTVSNEYISMYRNPGIEMYLFACCNKNVVSEGVDGEKKNSHTKIKDNIKFKSAISIYLDTTLYYSS